MNHLDIYIHMMTYNIPHMDTLIIGGHLENDYFDLLNDKIDDGNIMHVKE